MAQPDIVKLSDIDRKAFTDAYRFYERHHAMPNTVEAWEACYADLKRISESYEDSRLVSALLSVLYCAIDDRIRNDTKRKSAAKEETHDKLC